MRTVILMSAMIIVDAINKNSVENPNPEVWGWIFLIFFVMDLIDLSKSKK